jgi:hypothetical protein
VGEQDQCMSYVLGSHRIFHPYPMFFRNDCPLEYCRAHLPEVQVYNAVGQAGDVFLFDSNGAHRGNRRDPARVRDVFLIEYTTDKSDVWGGDINPNAFDGLPLPGFNPFAWMMTVEKKWNQPHTRQAPTWVENLPHVERWLQGGTGGPQ